AEPCLSVPRVPPKRMKPSWILRCMPDGVLLFRPRTSLRRIPSELKDGSRPRLRAKNSRDTTLQKRRPNAGEGAFAPDPLLLPLNIQNTCKFVLELAFLSEEWTVQRVVGSRVQDCLFREQFSAKNTRVKGAVESGGKWRSWDNSRIILLFPNCSEGAHILLFFKETSRKCACRTRSLALSVCILGLFFISLSSRGSAQSAQPGQTIERIDVSGNHRIPKDTILSRVFTRPGDIYDEAALQRDLRSVWSTGYFDDVRIEREQTEKGWTIHIFVREKPTIRTIEYHGLNAVSQSDVLERYKKVKVPLTVDSPYDATKVIKAKVALQELLAEHGRQFATITV